MRSTYDKKKTFAYYYYCVNETLLQESMVIVVVAAAAALSILLQYYCCCSMRNISNSRSVCCYCTNINIPSFRHVHSHYKLNVLLVSNKTIQINHV